MVNDSPYTGKLLAHPVMPDPDPEMPDRHPANVEEKNLAPYVLPTSSPRLQTEEMGFDLAYSNTAKSVVYDTKNALESIIHEATTELRVVSRYFSMF